jgi:predicted O-methyltransferase YrrM
MGREPVMRRLKFLAIFDPLKRVAKRLSEPRFDPQKRDVIAAEFARCVTVDDCIAFTGRHMGDGACQKETEIAQALDVVAATRPKTYCEIGTFDGGTSLLVTKFLPTLETMICLDLYVKNKALLRLLKPAELDIRFCELSSHSDEAVHAAQRALSGRTIDVLFIDGDHRYEGVKEDFHRFSPLVREGGLIMFHDIVQEKPDSKEWAGGVPQFWREISPRFEHREIVEDYAQSGFGIGILEWREPHDLMTDTVA